MRKLLLPSRRMLRGHSCSWRPSGQSLCHVFLQDISGQHRHQRNMQQNLMLFPHQLLRRQQSSNSRLTMSEHPQETWHKKREALEEERILGDQDEKTESTHTTKPSPQLLPVSLTLMHLTKELTPHFANLLSSSEDSWTSWKNARQCKSFKSCGYTTSKL